MNSSENRLLIGAVNMQCISLLLCSLNSRESVVTIDNKVLHFLSCERRPTLDHRPLDTILLVDTRNCITAESLYITFCIINDEYCVPA
jgi:hypothetical protein